MKYSERKISQCILPFRDFTKFTGKHLRQSLSFNFFFLGPEAPLNSILFKYLHWVGLVPLFCTSVRTWNIGEICLEVNLS